MRAIALFMCLCLMGVTTTGCGMKDDKPAGPKLANRTDHGLKETKKVSPSMGGEGKPSGGTLGLDWGDGKDDHVAGVPRKESPAGSVGKKSAPKGSDATALVAPSPPAVADAVVGVERSAPRITKEDRLQSGILTAGSFDDNVDPLVFGSFVRRMSQSQGLNGLPTKLQGQRLVVIVKDKSDRPVGNARVSLVAGASSVELTTRSDGRAVFIHSFDNVPAGLPLVATVTPPDGSRAVTETIAAGSSRWEITMPGVEARLPRNLDLAIVLDTTGSMGDELAHLKAEIRGIVEAVEKKFPEVQQRFSLVLYRDEGDEYVVRRFDFTSSLAEFHKNLSAQSAAGGGDYPEAIHKGLETATQLQWREKDTARVLFLVGDAPPHAQHMARTLAAADRLRKNGVAIYPVACSGYDQACEFVMRSCAMLTGSQFLFLTDDSGVGNSHAEPTIPYYQVERLERLMVRMITSELSGQHVQASPGEIIRTVGRKVN